jgi:hypothetical protein
MAKEFTFDRFGENMWPVSGSGEDPFSSPSLHILLQGFRELSQNCQARNETDANATFATSLQCLQILSQNQQTVKTLDSTAHRVPKVSCGRSISETVDAGVSRVEEAHRRQLMQSWSYHQRTI